MTELHEGDSDNDDKFMHACIIIVFLLIKLLYLLIHFIKSSTSVYTVLFSACEFYKFCCDIFIDCLLYIKSSIYLIFSH